LITRLVIGADAGKDSILSRVKNCPVFNVRRNVNKYLASFALIHEIIEELEPFEKPPTNKIKR